MRTRSSGDLEREPFEELLVEIQCYSCKDLPRPRYNMRYKCIDKGHSLCSECKGLDLEEEPMKCPCGSEISSKNCKLVQKLMKTTPWYCRNFKHGCREMFQVEREFNHHQLECIYRELRCCYRNCNKELLFKDFSDHFSECRPNAHRTYNVAKKSISFLVKKPELMFFHRSTFRPIRFDVFESSFFLITVEENGYYRLWMLALSSSPDVLKNYEWNLKITGAGKEKFAYSGEPFPIDKHYRDVLKGDDGFSIGIGKAVEIQEKLGKFAVNIEIHNFKDMESAVSTVGEKSK